MKTINNFIVEHLEYSTFPINEKLKISSKSKIDLLDFENADLVISIIKSVFISIMKNKTYKIRGISTYVIQRSKVNWTDIIDILNTEYNYMFDNIDIIDKKGKLQTFIRKNFDIIENLLNLKHIRFSINNLKISLNGFTIYQNDWKKYRDKYLKH